MAKIVCCLGSAPVAMRMIVIFNSVSVAASLGN